MNLSRRIQMLLVVLLLLAAGCNLPAKSGTAGTSGGDTLADLPIAQPLPAMAMTIINFQVEVPGDTPDEEIFLSVVDEVTGLALNASHFLMKGIPAPTPGAPRLYLVSLPVTIGSVIKYKYQRQTSSILISEHLTDGSAVRYRMYAVYGPATVKDYVSRWTDTGFQGQTGRITGQVMDGATGDPLPDILVTAGGAQTITGADGEFRIDGLIPGVHNLVAYAMDGSYHTFQQGAAVAADSATDAQINLEYASSVKAIFVVRVPEDTPPVIPMRMAGNLLQLGNTFSNLTGGLSSLVTDMPKPAQLPDGRYLLTLDLPSGVDLRYKYTLGDGFWNAEHLPDGAFRLRQIVVPDRDFLIEDKVDSWYAGSTNMVVFDLTVPAETPAQDYVSIQFNPLFGWTEPIPMWHLGGQRWAYVLYSPLNLPGNLSYRFCRDNQCGTADDTLTPGQYGQGRPAQITDKPQTLSDQVTEWLNLPWADNPFPIREATIPSRGAGYFAGIELTADYHPSWRSLLPAALDSIQQAGANWVVLSPSWSFNQANPGSSYPILEPEPGVNMLNSDLVEAISQAHQRELNVALFPKPSFPAASDDWWASAGRDDTWWAVWFEQYGRFILNQADTASQTGAQDLILGGEWLGPALPGGTLADGATSNPPADAEARWRELIAQVRQQFQGRILWAMTYQEAAHPPAFLDAIDAIYLLWSITPEEQAAAQAGTDLAAQITQTMDNTILTLQILEGKPIVLALAAPADPDPQAQFDTYQAMLNAANERDWITGFVSRGFYPPVALNDPSASVNGKPTLELLKYWFERLLGTAVQ